MDSSLNPSSTNQPGNADKTTSALPTIAEDSTSVVALDSSLHRSSTDENGNAEKTASALPTIAEDSTPAVALDSSLNRSSTDENGNAEKIASASPAVAEVSHPAVALDSTVHPSSIDEHSNAEEISPALSKFAEVSNTAVVQEPVGEWKVGRQEALIMMALMIVSLAAALDATVLVPALPTISRAIKGSATDAFWAGTSYLLACAVFQPFIASLSDIFGRRELLTLSVLLFTAGTLLCCLSQNFTELLAGRTIQGMGGGGIIALVMVIFTDIIPLRQRPKYMSLIQITWAFGTIAGPLVGGVFAQHASWRWVFIINFPFCALSLVAVPLVVKLKTRRSSVKEKLLRVDWFGGFIFVVSFTSFLMGLTWGGVQFPWSSFRTLVPLLIGILGIGATFAWEMWGAKQPFIRLAIFDSLSTVAIYVGAIVQGLMLFCILYYLPIYLEAVKDMSPTLTGAGCLGITCGLFPSSAVSSIVITRTGYLRWSIWTGWLIVTLGTGLMLKFGTHTSTATWASVFFLVGFGHGFLLGSMSIAAQAAAGPKDAAYATAMYAFVRTLGMVIGVAIGGAIFQNRLPRYLENAGVPIASALNIVQNADGYVTVLQQTPKESPSRQAIVEGYAEAFRVVFGVLTGISALGGLASLAIRHHTLDRELDSDHVFRRKPDSLP